MRGPWHRFRWLTSGLYVTLLAAAPVSSGTSTATPDLSGAWTLNEEQSQALRPATPEGAGRGRQGGGGGHRGGRRSGGGSGGGEGGEPGQAGARPGGEAGSGDEHRGAADFGLPKELRITVSGPQLTLASAEGTESRVLYTDGRKASEEKTGVGTVKTQAEWKDGALTVVTESPKGRKKTEIFEMTHDRKRLYVLVTLEGYGKLSGVTFKRVYEPEPPPMPPMPPTPPAPAAVTPAQPTEPNPPGRSWDEDDYDGDDFAEPA